MMALLGGVLTIMLLYNFLYRSISEQTEHLLFQNIPSSINFSSVNTKVEELRYNIIDYINGDKNARTEFLKNSVAVQHLLARLSRNPEVKDNVATLKQLFRGLQQDADQEIFKKFSPVKHQEAISLAHKIQADPLRKFNTFLNEIEQKPWQFFDKGQEDYFFMAPGSSAINLKPDDKNKNRNKDYEITYLHQLIKLRVSYQLVFHSIDSYLQGHITAESEFNKSINELTTQLTALSELPNNRADLARIQEMHRLLELTDSSAHRIFELQDANIISKMKKKMDELETDYLTKIDKISDEISKYVNNNTSTSIAQLKLSTSHTQTRVNAISYAVFALVILIFIYLIVFLVRPMIGFADVLNKLTHGNYDNKIPKARMNMEVKMISSGLLSLEVSLIELEKLRSDELHEMQAKHMKRLQIAYDELKVSENNIREQAEKLTRMNAELNQFVHIASHDLREPLKNMMGYCHMLKARMGNDVEPATAKTLENILTNSSRLCQLIDDLRFLTKLQSMIGEPELVEMQELWPAVIDEYSEEIHQRKTVLMIDPLPSVYGQKELLAQVMSILMKNALIHGTTPLSYSIKTESFADECRLRIRNNLAEPIQLDEQIFLPFWRGQKNSTNSTGIGLTICKKIIEEIHGGSIEYIPCEEAEFILEIRLPVAPDTMIEISN